MGNTLNPPSPGLKALNVFVYYCWGVSLLAANRRPAAAVRVSEPTPLVQYVENKHTGAGLVCFRPGFWPLPAWQTQEGRLCCRSIHSHTANPASIRANGASSGSLRSLRPGGPELPPPPPRPSRPEDVALSPACSPRQPGGERVL